ncbi:MAG: hypothetical protein H7Z21_04585, partial [Hymenobacter sp.]|nr:hypothetical protein [Hymenobacter sp.]
MPGSRFLSFVRWWRLSWALCGLGVLLSVGLALAQTAGSRLVPFRRGSRWG